MRRFLTALVIVLVVVVAGMSALVLLVDPNDFRSYMVKKVEDKTGYHLKVEGDLRWHVWPQLSILAGQMSLTAPGADSPIVSAENMRLDVELMPLFSHQLVVKNVTLKGGVIQLLPQTQAQTAESAPIAPPDATQGKGVPENGSAGSRWALELNQVKISDSILVWQRSENDTVTVRDINMTLERTDDRAADLNVSARINRDQRELGFSMDGGLNLVDFPQSLAVNISKFDYQLQGAGMPQSGIKGEGAFEAVYQRSPQSVHIAPLSLTVNDSQITADLSATLGETPHYALKANSESLDLDALFSNSLDNNGGSAVKNETPRPVTSSANGLSDALDLSVLKSFDATLELSVGSLTYHKIPLSGVSLKAVNKDGVLTLENATAKAFSGEFDAKGSVDGTKAQPTIALAPQIKHIQLGELLKTLGYPQTMTGQLTMQGNFNSVGSELTSLENGWRGSAHLVVDGARLHGLNIQQLIQQAVTRSNKDVKGMDNYERYTEVQRLVVDTVLNQGQVKVTRLNGASELLTVAGTGTLTLPKQYCDMNLNIRVTKGWGGKSEVVNILQKTTIPLRIYGPWSKLSYQLNVDQILRDQLKSQLGQALDKWLDKNKDKQESKDAKKLLEKLL
ncbi:outer membrane assembly protein AsmA [Leminorella grimontii]|nr:outer membrane assembly protein AsmA [Leminorella grimontii]KFC96912.1 AsmA family protein [Leminorella grimontii ATCC 33999 = DSM 5078]VFS57800.1 putative assembly protein [Leminorella grimontii]